ncbi:hypothetical protein MHU86_9162 [Fragilaria crotonensis]|nr:hypothetical protein MHU86_9162 [Fragilaria crotonensis]
MTRIPIPERDTPFPPDYTFSKENRPVTEQDIALVAQKQQRLPFCSASALSSTWHTTPELISSLLSANLPKPVLLLEFLTSVPHLAHRLPRRRPYYALKFYPDCTSNPIYEICLQHRIPMLILQVSLMPAGKTAQTLAAQPLAT